MGAGACAGWFGEGQVMVLTLPSLPTAPRAPSAPPAQTDSSCPWSMGTQPAAPCVPWPGRGPQPTWSLCTAPAATCAPCAQCPPTPTCASPSAWHLMDKSRRREGEFSTDPWQGFSSECNKVTWNQSSDFTWAGKQAEKPNTLQTHLCVGSVPTSLFIFV